MLPDLPKMLAPGGRDACNAHRSTSRSNKSDRQARIVAELRATPSLRVNELAGLLNVSTETVRRDLADLDERGLINRTYGGAMRPISFEPALAERERLMVERARAVSPRRRCSWSSQTTS